MRTWLIHLRKEKRLTQQQVAQTAHIDRAYYAQIESGTRNPSMAVASQIANVLSINPSLFFSDVISEPFELALINSPIIVAHCDLELRYTWMFNPHPDFDINKVIGKRDDQLAESDGVTALMRLKKEVIESGKTIRKKISLPHSNGLLHYDVFGQPLYNEKKDIIGAATASTELLP
ncbi:helix-turn-helix domain-containing protein [Halobacillus salinarum]|uniref:Helix-turn-helix domain-containing protein n=1 Tax=Halobacillus salinarum TaxID=2932257 RepID=A0ABY4EMH6_9BACI|nr:helix-turn-helix domain-containing protein [Halobacillus salinarum]UOQ45192.1 helix-turn-helix domain-containing protein [Halobacillus salinarum]